MAGLEFMRQMRQAGSPMRGPGPYGLPCPARARPRGARGRAGRRGGAAAARRRSPSPTTRWPRRSRPASCPRPSTRSSAPAASSSSARVRREFGYVVRPAPARRDADPPRPRAPRRRSRRRRPRRSPGGSSPARTTRPAGPGPRCRSANGWTATERSPARLCGAQRLRPLGRRDRERRRPAGGGRQPGQRHPRLGRPDARDLGGRLVPGDRRRSATALRSPTSTRPNNGGDVTLDVYLDDLGADGVFGYCTSDDPRPASPNVYAVSAYCVIDNDFAPAAVRRRPHAAGVPRGHLGARVPPRLPVRLRLARGLLADGGHRHQHRGDRLPGGRRQRRLPRPLEPAHPARLPARPRRARQTPSTAPGSSGASSRRRSPPATPPSCGRSGSAPTPPTSTCRPTTTRSRR